MMRVNQVHSDLHVWDKEVLKKHVHRIKKLRKELEKLKRGPMTDESIAAQKGNSSPTRAAVRTRGDFLGTTSTC